MQKYRLRCVFEFVNKPRAIGSWDTSYAGTEMWCKDKSGLLYAHVEAKDVGTNNAPKIVATVVGQDFCNFEWLATARLQVTKKGINGQIQEATNIGLVLVTRDKRINVMFSGEIFIEDRKEEDKAFNLAGY
jgi:hypothetical protein